MPTLPALTKRMPSIDPLELDVRVPADDDPLLDALERGPEALVRRDLGQDLVVVARRAVAVEDTVERDRQRQRAEELV